MIGDRLDSSSEDVSKLFKRRNKDRKDRTNSNFIYGDHDRGTTRPQTLNIFRDINTMGVTIVLYLDCKEIEHVYPSCH